MKISYYVFLLFFCHLGVALAQADTPVLGNLDSYADAFTNYQPLVTKSRDQKAIPPKPAVAPPPKPEEQKVDAAWLKKNYVLLETKAFDNPTKENLEAFAYVKRIVLDKSQRYAVGLDEVVRDDPILNENNRVPYSSSGSASIRGTNIEAQQNAVREMSKVGGIIVFVDGTCLFCSTQMPIIDMLRRDYKTEVLVVSLDGVAPKGFTGGTLVKDNGLFGKLQLKLTPSIVYVHKPTGYKDGQDTNQYSIIAQGYYALDELIKMMSFAGFKTNILSAETMKGLDIWNRGVATVNDLDKLTLDPSNPASFKQKLQPLLLKNY
jgi:conjugal transfer pilus assembly protein TraF